MWWLLLGGLATGDEVEDFLGWLRETGQGSYLDQVARDVLDAEKRAALRDELRRPIWAMPPVSPSHARRLRRELGVRPNVSKDGVASLRAFAARLSLGPHGLGVDQPFERRVGDLIGADCLTNGEGTGLDTFCPICRFRTGGTAGLRLWSERYAEHARWIDRFEE